MNKKILKEAVNHPEHYNAYSVEVIDLIRYLPFSLGNAIKYVMRSPFKFDANEDLRKAIFYLDDFTNNPMEFLSENEIVLLRSIQHEIPVQTYAIIKSILEGNTRLAKKLIEKELENK